MNVDDVKDKDVPTLGNNDCRLFAIFQRQHVLMGKYHEIESKNGFNAMAAPVDLHDRQAQARLKDFAWRVTEELAEATEARAKHANIPQHFYEELSDAYHFFVELLILSGFSSSHLSDLSSIGYEVHYDEKWPCNLHRLFEIRKQIASTGLRHNSVQINGRCYQVIESLGCAMNCLKNKPWKNTHMLTDANLFKAHLIAAHGKFIDLCISSGMDHDFLYTIYFKKSEVNKFRQRSNY